MIRCLLLLVINMYIYKFWYETESHDQLLSLYCLCAKYSLYQSVIINIHTSGLTVNSLKCHLIH